LLNFPIVKLFNRVLSDYPAAREKLRPHAGKLIIATVGPIETKMRVAATGEMELVGEGGHASTSSSSPNTSPNVGFAADVDAACDAHCDVLLHVPLALLPRLIRGDETAFSAVEFTGDSELASTLSTIARNVEWDVEEDLSKVMGDIAAHRIVDTAKQANAWQQDARERLTANVAEYLTEERRAFITTRELETLAQANESLRDDIARLEARVARL
jgi:ubiquinone biosynthesis protein UbiJ